LRQKQLLEKKKRSKTSASENLNRTT